MATPESDADPPAPPPPPDEPLALPAAPAPETPPPPFPPVPLAPAPPPPPPTAMSVPATVSDDPAPPPYPVPSPFPPLPFPPTPPAVEFALDPALATTACPAVSGIVPTTSPPYEYRLRLAPPPEPPRTLMVAEHTPVGTVSVWTSADPGLIADAMMSGETGPPAFAAGASDTTIPDAARAIPADTATMRRNPEPERTADIKTPNTNQFS